MKSYVKNILLATLFLVMDPLRGVQAEQGTTLNDKEMRIIASEDLKYPPFARSARIQGVVVVRAKLDNDGRVVEAAAISGHELLIPDSLANAKKWRFQPNAHRAAILVYNFRMPGGGCNSPTSFSIVEAPNFVSITGCDVRLQP